MTTTEQLEATPDVDAPVCTRCHGTGKEPTGRTPHVPDVNDVEQRRLLEQLRDAGERRRNANRHTVEGRQALDQAFEDIRVLTAEAGRLHITRVQVAEAVGLGRAQLYNILNGNPSGKAS